MASILVKPNAENGDHPTLLPARSPQTDSRLELNAKQSFVQWTFGRGCIIWRIWPAVLMYTIFASVIATSSINKFANLGIPTVMMTVLGVVIGFVLSYRAMSGYDRYWMGKTAWMDVVKNSRTLGRLIWFHVPLLLSPKKPEEIAAGHVKRSEEELNAVMTEKHMALDLIEGFAVALKHHLRGELGKYYEDLYPLIHDHAHTSTDQHRFKSPRQISIEYAPSSTTLLTSDRDPIIPPINSYGSFDAARARRGRGSPGSARCSSSASGTSEHQPLLPGNLLLRKHSLWTQASADFIPFSGLLRLIQLGSKKQQPPILPTTHDEPNHTRYAWNGPLHQGASFKHRPQIAGGGENFLPLDILRCLSEWLSVLEDRGTVPGTSLGSMMGVIAAFEDNLTTLERILTTPLPFTVWIYLFFLPFQLVNESGYYSILAVATASFIYLGFLAAGEEIEQPFGYDDNDLDLDLFCQGIIHLDIDRLKKSSALGDTHACRRFEQARGPTREETVAAVNGDKPSGV